MAASLTPEQRDRIDELFAVLAELPREARRQALAEEADPAVRAEVESLLSFTGEQTTGSFDLAVGKIIQAASEAGAFSNLGNGSMIGRYRIEKRLGQGGMGDVFEAFRDDDFRKRVALKIVRHGLNSEYALRRFSQERQVLAGLEHPNIARLLDGGTEKDLPYLVLEYVDGTPIDRYCSGLSRVEILRLFLKVCEAVEYAHQNLIIHRDLKPANILVTANGEPKLLDFGIAKVLDAASPDLTQTGLPALTPQYASPEQVRNEPITTASDVYALGMILYELLAGRKPYTLANTSAIEVDRLVCLTEPAPPNLSEDLDNIIMMALRKDPKRRYKSVREFADDIERSLSDLPVLARPDSFGYRAGKFIRRNRVSMTAGALVAIALAAGVVVSQYQAQRAARRFTQVRKLANKFLFEFDNAIAPVAGTTKARELVVSTALEYLDNLAEDAKGDHDLEAELAAAFEKLGDVQGSPSAPSLGRPEEALKSYRRSRELWSAVVAARPNDWSALKLFTSVTLKSGDVELRTNRKNEAAASFEQGAALAERAYALAPSQPDLAYLVGGAWYRRGELARDEHDPARARQAYEKSLERYRMLIQTHPTPRHQNAVAMTESKVGLMYMEEARIDEAIPHLELSVAERRKLAAAHPETAAFRRGLSTTLANLASAFGLPDVINLGETEKAEKALREALAIQESLAAADSADRVIREDLLVTRYQLGAVILRKNPSEALRLSREAKAAVATNNNGAGLRTDIVDLLDNASFTEAQALAALRRGAEALQVLDGLKQGPEAAIAAMDYAAVRSAVLIQMGKAAEAQKILENALRPVESKKVQEMSLSDLRRSAKLHELMTSLPGVTASARCQNEVRERAIWTEWATRKSAPQWYAKQRLPALAVSSASACAGMR